MNTKNNNEYERRLAAALAELDSKGVSRRVSRPPYFQLARKLNLNVRPPYYASFGFNAIFACVVFTLFWSFTMWILVWSKTDLPLLNLIVKSLNGGLIVGLVTALFCYGMFRFYKLTPWDSLTEKESSSSPS